MSAHIARHARFCAVALGALLVGLPAVALAQANYESALIGGRSSLLGGTGVAAGTDAAAPLQNPATAVDIEGTSFVFSTFFLELSQRSLTVDEAALSELRAGSSELAQTQVRVLPNSTCLFVDLVRAPSRAGRHKLAICFAEPERSAFELTSRVAATTVSDRLAYQQRVIRQDWSKKSYAVSWAFAASERLSFGVTPILYEIGFRDYEALATLSGDAADASELVGSEGSSATNVLSRRASAFSASALIGAQYIPAPDWRIGLSVETPTLPLFGSYEAVRSGESSAGAGEQYAEETGSAKAVFPLRAAFGAAGRLGPVRFELDGYLHTAVGDFFSVEAERRSTAIENGTVTEYEQTTTEVSERARPVLNLGLGVEVPVAREWSVVAGVLSDLSGLEAREAGALWDEQLFRQRLDAVHASLGVAWQPRVGSILCGVRGMYGQGELGVSDVTTAAPTMLVAEQSLWGLALVVSGQLSLEMLAVVDPTGLIEAPKEPPPGASSPTSP
jgi:hypothetical protein